MSVTRHWVAYDKDGFGAHAVITRAGDAGALRRAGHEVEGPFVLEAEQPQGAADEIARLEDALAGNGMSVVRDALRRAREAEAEVARLTARGGQ